MEHKKIRFISILSLSGLGTGLILLYSPVWGWCEKSTFCDTSFLDEGIGQPLILFSLSISLLSIILYFLREEVFRSWARFAKWYLSASVVLLVLGSNQHGGYISGGLNDRESMTWFLAGLFFVISLFLIATKSWKLRGT